MDIFCVSETHKKYDSHRECSPKHGINGSSISFYKSQPKMCFTKTHKIEKRSYTRYDPRKTEQNFRIEQTQKLSKSMCFRGYNYETHTLFPTYTNNVYP